MRRRVLAPDFLEVLLGADLPRIVLMLGRDLPCIPLLFVLSLPLIFLLFPNRLFLRLFLFFSSLSSKNTMANITVIRTCLVMFIAQGFCDTEFSLNDIKHKHIRQFTKHVEYECFNM